MQESVGTGGRGSSGRSAGDVGLASGQPQLRIHTDQRARPSRGPAVLAQRAPARIVRARDQKRGASTLASTALLLAAAIASWNAMSASESGVPVS